MTGRRHAQRGVGARVAVFAVLFQAILFGWHHHDLRLSGRLPAPVVENSSSLPQIADDEDACEICQVLHHLTAAPVDFVGAPAPPTVAPIPPTGDTAAVARPPALAFRARAPPSLDAVIG